MFRWNGWFVFFPLIMAFPVFADNSIRQLVQENRISEALTPCRQKESLKGVDAETESACAWVFYRAGKTDSGDRILANLKKAAPTRQLKLLEIFSLMQKKQLDAARAQINALSAEYKTGSFGALVGEVNGELYELQGQNDTAAFLYRQVLAEDPERGRAHWGMARYHLSKNEVPKAREHLEKTMKLWPKHVGSRYNMAVIALNDNKFADAAKWLVESYRLDKGDPGILEQMGVLFEKRGKMKEAIKFWQRARAINKETVLANQKLQQFAPEAIARLSDKKDYDGAMDQLNATPDSKITKKEIRKAILLRNMGKLAKSNQLLIGYLKKSPHDATAYRELGINHLNNKDGKSAIVAFLKALQWEPNNGTNYAWVGFTLEGQGKYLEAKEAWKKAIELLSDPKEIEKAQRRFAALEKKSDERRKEAREKAEDGDEDRDVEKEMGSMDIFEGIDGIPK